MMVGHVLGIDFDFVEPNFQAGDLLTEDYLDKNPMHTIPLLEDRDYMIADSHAIAIYLITKFGGTKRESLYPEDVYVSSTIDSRLHFDTGVLFQRLQAITVPTVAGYLSGPTDEHIAKVEDAYQMLENYLNKTTYLACDHFTVADICAGSTVTSLNTLIPVDCERYPRLIEWIESLYAEFCFTEVNSSGLQEFSSFMHQCWDGHRNSVQVSPPYYMGR